MPSDETVRLDNMDHAATRKTPTISVSEDEPQLGLKGDYGAPARVRTRDPLITKQTAP